MTKEENSSQEFSPLDDAFRTFFDTCPVGMAMASASGAVLRANRALHDYLGYTREEFKRLTVSQITHPDDVQETRQCFERMREGKCDFDTIRKRYRRRNGAFLRATTTFWVFRDEHGHMTHDIAFIQDDSDQVTRHRQSNVLSEIASLVGGLSELCSKVEMATEDTEANASLYTVFEPRQSGRDSQQRLVTLTLAEREVLALVTSGLPNKAIAMELRVSVRTVEDRRRRIMEKLKAKSFAELIRIVVRAEQSNGLG